jgi:hypothetical protein
MRQCQPRAWHATMLRNLQQAECEAVLWVLEANERPVISMRLQAGDSGRGVLMNRAERRLLGNGSYVNIPSKPSLAPGLSA